MEYMPIQQVTEPLFPQMQSSISGTATGPCSGIMTSSRQCHTLTWLTARQMLKQSFIAVQQSRAVRKESSMRGGRLSPTATRTATGGTAMP